MMKQILVVLCVSMVDSYNKCHCWFSTMCDYLVA
jgi:hypothetical protein